MVDAFYEPSDDGRFLSTEHTRGPWDPSAQHAGPPSALLGRAVERAAGRDDAQVARITMDILRPVPIAPLRVDAEVVRGGRSVMLCLATLTDEQGPVMHATAWVIRTADIAVWAEPIDGPPPPLPTADEGGRPFFVEGGIGYHAAMEWRFARGAFLEQGPATVWMRMRCPLVAGEEPSPLVRVLAAADSGNGVSAAVDFTRFVFINTDLTVHLHRLPVGEWVCLDAHTVVQQSGIGLATSRLHDEDGAIGMGLQTLYVAPRAS